MDNIKKYVNFAKDYIKIFLFIFTVYLFYQIIIYEGLDTEMYKKIILHIFSISLLSLLGFYFIREIKNIKNFNIVFKIISRVDLIIGIIPIILFAIFFVYISTNPRFSGWDEIAATFMLFIYLPFFAINLLVGIISFQELRQENKELIRISLHSKYVMLIVNSIYMFCFFYNNDAEEAKIFFLLNILFIVLIRLLFYIRDAMLLKGQKCGLLIGGKFDRNLLFFVLAVVIMSSIVGLIIYKINCPYPHYCN
ncbi:MAG: hypothetical protein RBR98_03565 [Candidatus Moranbacteria bacterium]|jgi:hypothetical protein|nr:hypothetical protein [Candidatus Moranbacteria bacterium]NLC30557.1 hypothetical protein [Candidatus Moranbacteria bacterium]